VPIPASQFSLTVTQPHCQQTNLSMPGSYCHVFGDMINGPVCRRSWYN